MRVKNTLYGERKKNSEDIDLVLKSLHESEFLLQKLVDFFFSAKKEKIEKNAKEEKEDMKKFPKAFNLVYNLANEKSTVFFSSSALN